jgi:hypothetical protein
MAAASRLSLVQGDTGKLRIEVLNADGSPLDLTPFISILFTIKRSRQDSDAAAIFQGSLDAGIVIASDITDNHAIDVSIPADNTAALRTGLLYFWDVQIKDTDDNTYTPCSGDLLVDGQITLG